MPCLDHLSVADKETYETNVELLRGLQQDLQTKTEKYKNNSKLYERFIPGIVSSIQDMEMENKNLLEGKVRPFAITNLKISNRKVPIVDKVELYVCV